MTANDLEEYMKQKFIFIFAMVFLLACYDNKKLPEGHFAVFGEQGSWMLRDAWLGLVELKEARYSDISMHTEMKDGVVDIAEIEKQIQKGKTLIWLFRSMIAEDALRFLINQYPHQKFALICEGPVQEPESTQVANIFYAVNEGAFLAGFMAAKMSSKQYLGVVTGDSTKDSPIYAVGFYAGALAARPRIKISHINLPGKFSQQAIKNAALDLNASGADIVFLALEEGLQEALLAAQEKKFLVIGCELQHDSLYKKNLLTTVVKQIDMTVFHMSNDVMDRIYPGGLAVTYGLSNGLVGLSKETHSHVPIGLRREIEQLVLSVIMKEVKVPKNQIELEQFGYRLTLQPVKRHI